MAPRLIPLMPSGSNKKELRYACLSEAKASHSQRMRAEVSSLAPHFLRNGLSDISIRWKCLLRVLCPVRRPVITLPGFCHVKGQKPSLGTQTGSQNLFSDLSLGITKTSLPYPVLVNQPTSNPSSYFLPRFSRPAQVQHSRAEPPLANSLAIFFPHTLARPGTQDSPTACRVEISFNAFWHRWTNGDIALTAWRALRGLIKHAILNLFQGIMS
jgi:hypothetical protein